MKFTCNTKPLADALDIGVISANISNYHKKSNIAQVTCGPNGLVINLEALNLRTELHLKGSWEGEEQQTRFVSSLLLKQLVSTFDTATVTIEYLENGLILHSGKSKFTLPQAIQADELELDKPAAIDASDVEITINKDDWKYIKDNQMYAIAMSFIHPVYTKVWIGDEGDVIVGDIDNSLFTLSKKGKLGSTCLLSDSIINLFVTLPEGAKLSKHGSDYIISASSDSMEYISQFTPMYESDENVGSYMSEIFIDAMKHPEQSIAVNAAVMGKFLSQATLLSTNTDDSIILSTSSEGLTLKDKNVDCKIQVGTNGLDFSQEFNTEALRKVIANYGDAKINISPSRDEEGEVTGILIWDENLTTLIGGVEEGEEV